MAEGHNSTEAPVDGRTIWWGKDAIWWDREWIVVLGLEFGPSGPAVIDWLSCHAKLQNKGGWVKAGVHTCARGCFVDVVTVCHVLSRAVAIGQLEEWKESNGRFVCRISGWESDQRRAMAANRKAEQRARDRADDSETVQDRVPSVTPGHGESRPVTESHLTGQDRTVKGKASELRSEAVEPTDLDQVRQDREQTIFDAWLTATARTHSTLFDEKRRRCIRKALALKDIGYDDVIDAVRGVQHSDHHLSNKQWSELRVILRDVAQIEHFRDLYRSNNGTTAATAAELAEHPCSVDDTAIAEWDRVIERAPEHIQMLLTGSHPHATTDPDALLIGARSDFAAILAGHSRTNPLWLGPLTDGRPVQFLACPQLERSAA